MKSLYRVVISLLLILFAIFYPMLISIYVFLPLLIGVAGYFFMLGLEKNRFSYVAISLIYFINLEANLTLPFFLTMITSLLVYMIFFHHLNYFRKCKLCKAIISVILINHIYLGILLSYDFIFQTNSIFLDNILLYSLVIDILMVVIL